MLPKKITRKFPRHAGKDWFGRSALRVLVFVALQNARGQNPSIREIADLVTPGGNHTSTHWGDSIVKRLLKLGLLTREGVLNRSLRVSCQIEVFPENLSPRFKLVQVEQRDKK